MRSLYSKLVLMTAAIMVISALLAFLGINTYYHQVLKVQNDEKNMSIAQSLVTFIETNEGVSLEEFLETQAATGYKLYLVDEDGRSKLYGEPFRVENLSQESVDRVLAGNAYHGMANLPSETFMTGYFSNELTNTVGLSFVHEGRKYALFLRPDIKMLFSEIHYIIAGLMTLMGIISLLAMLIVAKKLIEPITELTLATKKVGKEQFNGDLHIHRRDEIGQLAHSFQQMTERLSENNRIRKEFVSDVSHDFQTPLLNIKGYSDLLLGKDLSEKERIDYAKVIQSETNRLSSLTKQLLLLTSIDQLSAPLEYQTIRLDEQLRETARKFRWLLDEKEMSLSMDLQPVYFTGDPNFLEKVWENLLSNALKYTQQEGNVDIDLTETSDSIIITIRDNGIGVDEHAISRIFDRFFRADDSRTQEVIGTGLGLSIVQEVVHLHDGEVVIESQDGDGTTCIVRLPKM
ncbi:two-component sensor histidine kinase [Sporosarcina ureilytica]|uniref:Heme sensor protein HssS n=2 Tax=Sporosarcina ureilytica TaxID=298596 RepID=A0A1D8JJW4_9BACL|nr:two-component sensor histidine kinase [Sporosarcina ureilytica]